MKTSNRHYAGEDTRLEHILRQTSEEKLLGYQNRTLDPVDYMVDIPASHELLDS